MDDSNTSLPPTAGAAQTQPRKRLGRPPKKAAANAAASTVTSAATARAAASTPSPVSAAIMNEDSSEATATPQSVSPTFGECRRSSRKKIIKFDVRDLLNKNRNKNHKIQIEARIDSNAKPVAPAAPPATPPAAPSAAPSAPAASPAPSGAIKPVAAAAVRAGPATDNRRFSMFEPSRPLRNPLLTPPAPPPPLPAAALDMFAKPKPTQSLIVAQVSSGYEEQSPQPPRSVKSQASPALTLPQQTQAAPRKRGRPRKQPLTPQAVAAPQAETGPATPTTTASTSTSYSDSSDTISNASSEGLGGGSSGEVKPKGTPKLRVSVKRINMPPRAGSSSSSDSLGSSSPSAAVSVVDVSISSTASSVSSPLVPEPEAEADAEPAINTELDENAVDANFVAPVAAVTAAADEDSDSQIIFVEIETVKPEEEAVPKAEEAVEGRRFLELFEDSKEAAEVVEEEQLTEEALSEPHSVWSVSEEEAGATNGSSGVLAERTSPKEAEESPTESLAKSSSAELSSNEAKNATLPATLIDLVDDSLSQPEQVSIIIENELEECDEAAKSPSPDIALDSQKKNEPESPAEDLKASAEQEVCQESSSHDANSKPQEEEKTATTGKQDKEKEEKQPKEPEIFPEESVSNQEVPKQKGNDIPSKETILIESPQPETKQECDLEISQKGLPSVDLPEPKVESEGPQEASHRSILPEEEPKKKEKAEEEEVIVPPETTDRKELSSDAITAPTTTTKTTDLEGATQKEEPQEAKTQEKTQPESGKMVAAVEIPAKMAGSERVAGKRTEELDKYPLKVRVVDQSLTPFYGTEFELASEPPPVKIVLKDVAKMIARDDRAPRKSESKTEAVKDKVEPTKQEESLKGTEGGTANTKQPETSSSSGRSSGEKKPVAFVECDALFKAMDKARDQLRLEEKTKKKLKQEAKKHEQEQQQHQKLSQPNTTSTTTAAAAVQGENNTATANPIPTPTPSVKSESLSQSPPPSLLPSSSDSSRVSTPNLPESAAGAGSAKGAAKRGRPRKQISRRNTLNDERSDEADDRSPMTKRRFSVHPKASCDLFEQNPGLNISLPRSNTVSPMPTKAAKAGKKSLTTTAKKKRKPRGQNEGQSLQRQDSFDSTSSASQSAPSSFKANRRRNMNDFLQGALTETESSESTSSSSKMQRFMESSTVHTPAPSSLAGNSPEPLDPLKDIAKFIEDGVNLLKRDYKIDDDDSGGAREAVGGGSGEPSLSESPSPKTVLAEGLASLETPAMTPESTPAPSPSPQPSEQSTVSSGTGVRRSHRIKQKPRGPKASVGRGVVRDDGETTVAAVSMEDQLMELAQIEAINEQFLRQEGLNTFQTLRDNYYRCARQVSQENAEMQCDCFLTGDEEAQGHLCCGAGCINRMLMIECGPLCTNGDRCTNKRFQKHQCWPCRVFRTEKKGCGITAELQIPPGEFIMEYVGEVIDSEEFERRQHLYSRDKNRHYYFMALRGEAIIDATAKGNISRYINHSCDPNAETQKWTVNGELRIGFFSRKTILPGEEITFDYQYQRYGRDAQRCYCEAANCRGWIGGEPDSDEGEQIDSYSEEDYEGEGEAEAENEPESTENFELNSRRKSLSGVRKLKEPKAKSLVKLKLPSGRKRKEQVKAKDREYKAGRWLRPASEKTPRKPSKVKFRATLEDPDVLEELSQLSRSGLKNQVDTLRFSRCMVRAKLAQTRLNLLGVLTRGELPCRRLFLDYHGLRLLHAWMNESGSDHELRLALLEALESLPIPNKTMLNDSRVYQVVQLWGNQPPTDELPEKVRQRILSLIQKWDALPEIFRIPKRERIEQMKEHEREADRQQNTAALGDNISAMSALDSDRYRHDRFRRDTSSRYTKPKPPQMSGNNTICTITTTPTGSHMHSSSSGNQSHKEGANGGGGRHTPNSAGGSQGTGGYKGEQRRRSELGSVVAFDRPKPLSKELRREMFERKVAQDEAEKRVSNLDWREHERRCEYFGADITIDPKMLPFYQNLDTQEWFNSDDMPVPAPQRCGRSRDGMDLVDVDDPMIVPGEVQPSDYKLPPSVEPLPPAWHWGVTATGDIYYYHLRDRISQWEPPTPQQRMKPLEPKVAHKEEQSHVDLDEHLLVNIDVDILASLSPKALAEYMENKVRERREMRRAKLVSVCIISPRREEDRIYNQIESRKYKENKEKIRKRKELFRRRRLDTLSEPLAPLAEYEKGYRGALPIQGYLFSSEEEPDSDSDVGGLRLSGASTSILSLSALPLIDVIVDGDKNVDELDALNSRRQLQKQQLQLSLEPSTSKALPKIHTAAEGDDSNSPQNSAPIKRKLPMPPLPEHSKRNRLERDKRRKGLSSGSSASDKFRTEISAHVSDFLRPYKRITCTMGRITSEEDYKFLVKRLSHHITTKEMRYCEVTGNPLACTESVRHKSFDFINQYMRKKGKVYKRPSDDPDY